MKEPKAIFKIQQKMLLKNMITEMKYSTGRLGGEKFKNSLRKQRKRDTEHRSDSWRTS